MIPKKKPEGTNLDPEKKPTQDRIVEAAVQLFSEQGFQGSTTREIARIADVNEVTLFRYFKRKQDLFWAALEHRLKLVKLDCELQKRLASDEDPAKVLAMIFSFLVEIILGHPELVRLLYFSWLEFGHSSDRIYRKQLQPVFSAITCYLERCSDRSAIRPVDPFVVVLGFVGTVMAHQSIYPMLTGKNLSRQLDKTIPEYIDFWLSMLKPPIPRHGSAEAISMAQA